MIRALFVAVLLLVAQLSCAHDLDLTLIKLNRLGGFTQIEVSTPLSRLARVFELGDQPSGPDLDRAVRSRLGESVLGESVLKVDSQADLIVWTGTLKCGATYKPSRFDESTSAARTIVENYAFGKLESEQILDKDLPQSSTPGMVKTGIEHILSGLDHILFIVGLALLGGSWRQILRVLTAFTIAHSVTLTAATLGWISGNPRIVEPLIAFSIVALAVEGIWSQQSGRPGRERVRMGIAFAFGLVHGLGFAGGLAELGLRGNQLISHLVSFSLGIEIGQMMILAPILGFFTLVTKLSKERGAQVAVTSSVLLGMFGSFWFMERLVSH